VKPLDLDPSLEYALALPSLQLLLLPSEQTLMIKFVFFFMVSVFTLNKLTSPILSQYLLIF